ncbi:hypothetical protein C8F04DRAFT_971599 [Mycena alexandri]|uniref:Uncharacterized protein n=1 Tax=Mycena alexandri TaxID=1745969 RepID=A0AAD6S856_9AGAR|nr:hypothetical protein C8F04DRAFT_971599 [Mycena alexandri]
MGPRVPEPISYSEWRPSGASISKRKNAILENTETPTKRQKLNASEQVPSTIGTVGQPFVNPRIVPVGFVWDSVDYSCGYDATFTILANLWLENRARWSANFTFLGTNLGSLGVNLQRVIDRSLSLEQARDIIRRKMHSTHPALFPYGPNGTSIDRIADNLLPSHHYGNGRQHCPLCGFSDGKTYSILESAMSVTLDPSIEYPQGVTIQEWLNSVVSRGRAGDADQIRLIDSVSPLMIFSIDHARLKFNEYIIFDCNNLPVRLRLRGIIYGGQAHFTSRFVDKEGVMWFHDGITTASRCLEEVGYRSILDLLSLQRCGDKHAVAVVYAKEY